MRPHLEAIALESAAVLYEPGEPLRHVYFPSNGLVSILAATIDGDSIEVGVVGFDGMVGIPVILGGTSPYRALVQIPGLAFRMKASKLQDFFNRRNGLHGALLRYTHAFMTQITQSGVCNHFHTVDQRLCRWLLAAQDRSSSDTLLLTQELVSRMLGIRRASVTVAASTLQRAGLIRYSRGEITILNRRGLEAASCECYRLVRDSWS
jgi:CRP-like cAMP-binding protein